MILGIKVRKQDLVDMLKFNPKILEFHFSDSDLFIIGTADEVGIIGGGG